MEATVGRPRPASDASRRPGPDGQTVRHEATRRPEHRPAPLHGVPLVLCVVPVAVGLVIVMLLAISIGSVHVPIGDVWGIVVDHLGLTGRFDPTFEQIVWQYRVPRVLLAALAGAGLSVSGVVLQAVVGNPLADPHVLGIAPGAGLGAALALTGGLGAAGGPSVSAAAFTGAVVAVVVVFALGQRQGRIMPVRLVLAGVAVAYLFMAMTSYIQIQATPNELSQIMFWLLGSVSGAQWSQLQTVTLLVVAATLGLTVFGRRLNVLVGGDESAVALGLDVHRARVVLLGLASLLTGLVISVAGGIGFVGLMIPHLVRLAVGADHRRVLPLAALVGATYLVAVDLLSRTVDRPNELPIGIFTAACGVPFFIWLLRRSQTVT
jgi:iron complex transport system permease protein